MLAFLSFLYLSFLQQLKENLAHESQLWLMIPFPSLSPILFHSHSQPCISLLIFLLFPENDHLKGLIQNRHQKMVTRAGKSGCGFRIKSYFKGGELLKLNIC